MECEDKTATMLAARTSLSMILFPLMNGGVAIVPTPAHEAYCGAAALASLDRLQPDPLPAPDARASKNPPRHLRLARGCASFCCGRSGALARGLPRHRRDLFGSSQPGSRRRARIRRDGTRR